MPEELCTTCTGRDECPNTVMGHGRYDAGCENYIPADNVHHPNHYTQGGIECIEAIKASMHPHGFQDYCKGNVIKYIWRYRDKGGSEDLAKAQVYLTWLIDSVLEEEKEN